MTGEALFEIDLAAVPRELRVGSGDRRARILVFEAGQPLGWLELEPAGGTVSGHAVRAAAEHALGPARCRARLQAGFAAGGEPLPLTVAVCTHERPELLRDCLSHLMAQSHPELWVLVVDNAPRSRATAEVAAGFERVRYVCEPRQGLDFARNRALAESEGELLAFVDDDALVHRHWALAVARAFEREPAAVAVTGLVVPAALDTPAELAFEEHGGFGRGFAPRRIEARVFFERPWRALAPGICGAGCNMAFRRRALLGIGGFDDSLDVGRRLPGGGDLDAFSRLLRAGGLIVYEPAAVVRHRHRRDMAGLRRQMYQWGRGYTAALCAAFVDDRRQRWHALRALGWWFVRYQVGERLVGRARGRHRARVGFVLLELLGGLMGPLALLSTRRYARRSARS